MSQPISTKRAAAELGFEVGKSIVGSIPVKMTSRIAGDTPDDGMAVEADLRRSRSTICCPDGRSRRAAPPMRPLPG